MWSVDLYRAYFINPSRFQVGQVHWTSTARCVCVAFLLMGQASQMLVVVGKGV